MKHTHRKSREKSISIIIDIFITPMKIFFSSVYSSSMLNLTGLYAKTIEKKTEGKKMKPTFVSIHLS